MEEVLPAIEMGRGPLPRCANEFLPVVVSERGKFQSEMHRNLPIHRESNFDGSQTELDSASRF